MKQKPLWTLSDERLENLEALYLRLLNSQTDTGIRSRLYLRLCAVRAEMFKR